jgi:hypothetical protein
MTDAIDAILDRFSKRCPECRGVNFTSDNRGNHRCLDCGAHFTDATALPSIAREEAIEAKKGTG